MLTQHEHRRCQFPQNECLKKTRLAAEKKIIFNNNVKSVKAARVLCTWTTFISPFFDAAWRSTRFLVCSFQYWNCSCNGTSSVAARWLDFNPKYPTNPRHCRRSDRGEVIISRSGFGRIVLGSCWSRSANANSFRETQILTYSSHNVSQFVPRIKVRCINWHWCSSIPTVIASAANGSRRQQWHNFLAIPMT